MQAEIEEDRGEERDGHRERKHAPGEGIHGAAQRPLVNHEIDEDAGVLGRGPHHAQHAVLRLRERGDRVRDEREVGRLAQIVGLVDDGRHVAIHHQHARVAVHVEGDRIGIDVLQKLDLELRAQDVGGGGLEGQGRDVGGADLLLEIIDAEARNPRGEDQDLGHHREQHGEDQQLGRKAVPKGRKIRKIRMCIRHRATV